MVTQLDLLAPSDGNLRLLRALLGTLHGELRDRGLSPMEAAEVAAAGLAGENDARVDGTSMNQLRALAIESPDRGPLLALLYQEFLVAEARSGLGQYLTPMPVADLIAETLADVVPTNPQVMDPFCGAGILLDRFSRARPDARLQGLEINLGVGAMAKALSQFADHDLELWLTDTFETWAQGDLPESDVVVTNPPFGSIASSINSNGHSAALPPCLRAMKRIPAELLGLEVSVDALGEGGWLGIVLPQSILTNSSWSEYRKHLFSKLRLSGVVSLPEETFAPFRGVAKACVIFGRKHTEQKTQTQSAPFFRSRSIGYDETGRTAERESDLMNALAFLRGLKESEWALQIDITGAVNIPSTIQNNGGQYVRLGDIAEVFTGRTPPRDSYVDKGPFLLKVGNLRGSFICWNDRKRSRIPEKMYQRTPKLQLKPGDICLTAAAHRPRYIGQKVDLVYEIPRCGAMPSAEVLVIRLHPDAPVEPEEILFHLRGSAGYQQIQDLVRGSTAHLYPKDVSEIHVPTSNPASTVAIELFRTAAELHQEAVQAEQIALRAAGLVGRASIDNL